MWFLNNKHHCSLPYCCSLSPDPKTTTYTVPSHTWTSVPDPILKHVCQLLEVHHVPGQTQPRPALTPSHTFPLFNQPHLGPQKPLQHPGLILPSPDVSSQTERSLTVPAGLATTHHASPPPGETNLTRPPPSEDLNLNPWRPLPSFTAFRSLMCHHPSCPSS